MIVELGSSITGEPILYPLPQLGFPSKDGNDRRFFTIPELNAGLHKKTSDIATEGEILFFSSGTPREVKRLEGFILGLGKKTKESHTLPPIRQRVEVLEAFPLDSFLLRAILKIGFNYLAYRAGSDLVLNPCFDPLRAFIRYGKEPKPDLRRLISITLKPIFANQHGRYRSRCHALTVQWHENRRAVLAQVTLFHTVLWNLVLTEDFPGIWRQIKGGHIFDLKTMTAKDQPLIAKELVLRKYW